MSAKLPNKMNLFMIEYASNLSIKNIKALRKAIKRIIKVALNPDMPIQASFKACQHVLDFSMGKPIRADEHIEPIGIELSKMDLEEVLRDLKLYTDGAIMPTASLLDVKNEVNPTNKCNTKRSNIAKQRLLLCG